MSHVTKRKTPSGERRFDYPLKILVSCLLIYNWKLVIVFFYFQNESFTAAHGARDASVPKILVVLTDGQSTDPPATAVMADQLHRAGIKVITIGIGQNVHKSELTVIATDRNHVFTATDFKSLSTLQTDLQLETCRSMRVKVFHVNFLS